MTLRIQKSAEPQQAVFRLIGRIQGDQVSELRALLKSDGPEPNLFLDLKEVKLVDRDAVRFLAEIEAEGARLRNCPQFIREWISQERAAMRRTAADPEVKEE